MHFISEVPGLKSNHGGWATTKIHLATLVIVADTAETDLRLPNIANDLHAKLGNVQWLVTGYLLAISVFLMPMGRISDMIGRK
jgi:DHA2 family methylenomycin A resistance protein-like MFS transporter